MTSAYLFVTHGSHDPRPHRAVADLVDRIRRRLSASVGTAVLECSAMELHEQIQQFSQPLDPGTPIQIVPLFLLPGVHVMEDIPAQVAIAQQHVHTELILMPHLGSNPELGTLLVRRMERIASPKILLSHGSRRSGGNRVVEILAHQLNALPAFWSVAPSLVDRIEELSQQGCQEIAILPYFLFAGKIIDAIATQVNQLSQYYAHLKLELLTPIEVSDDLVDLIVKFLFVQPRSDLVIPLR